MILISVALVIVAAVLLALGSAWSLSLVYAAIVLSVLSVAFLLIGVVRRPAPSVAQPEPSTAAAGGSPGADVVVISGRPRYHLTGCHDLDGSADPEPLGISEARELGFTPCGACRPDERRAAG